MLVDTEIKTKWLKLRQFILAREWLLAVIVALAVIIVGVGLGYENNKIVPINSYAPAHYTAEPGNHLSFLSNWDGPNYLDIATHGYNNIQLTNFFPLYPIIIHIVNLVISSPLYSALLVAWASLVGAIYFYLKIIKHFFGVHDNLDALRGVLLFVLFPTGVFLIATYTESLFAFLSLGAIYYALQRRYIATGLFTLLATATHINGIFLLVLIALLLIEGREKFTHILSSLVIGALGLIGYITFLSVRFHKPFAFLSAQRNHGWFEHSLISVLGSVSLLNYLFVAIILIATVYWWKRRKSFSIYSFLYLCIPFVGGEFGGFPRYSLMAFPVQFMLYDYFRSKRLAYTIIIAMTSVCWAYFLFQYAGGYIGG